MRLLEFKVENYRSIDSVSLHFDSPYTAICGRNDAGKSNMLRALCLLLQGEGTVGRLHWHDDWPRWKKQSTAWRIHISARCVVSKDADATFFTFLIHYLSLKTRAATLDLWVASTWSDKGARYEVSVGTKAVTEDQASEIVKRIHGSTAVVLYNSAALLGEPAFAPLALLNKLSNDQKRRLEAIRQSLGKFAGEVATEQQTRLNKWLKSMNFQSHFKIAVVPSTVALPDVPFQLTMGDDDGNIPLRHWGAGTQNRTRILMSIFDAAGVDRSKDEATDITPIVLIEEPESYLHPSGQSKFSELLQDLARQLEVQIVATTHSPHMLALANLEANVLLERVIEGNSSRTTKSTGVQGPAWKEAFALTLGLDSELLGPWEEVLSKGKHDLILVEGIIDKRYLELLRDCATGTSRLMFEGEIVPYNGKDQLKSALPKFVRERHRRCVVTYDLDAESDVSRNLSSAGFKKGLDQIAIGINESGKKNIEGLLPLHVIQNVHAREPNKVMALMDHDSRERAKRELKSLYLEEFERLASQGDQSVFDGFRELAASLNAAFGQAARRAGA